MPNYEFECTQCGVLIVEFRKYEERDIASTCTFCDGAQRRVYRTAPGGMFTALPDGTKRDENYQRIKEAAKLEKEAANTRPERRKEINKEITKLRSVPK